MKLTEHPAVIVASGMTADEHDVLIQALYFLDPARKSDYNFRQGEWDGMRNCFLDAEHTVFPSGLKAHALSRLFRAGIRPEIVREIPDPPTVILEPHAGMLEGWELRDYQVEAIKSVVNGYRGIVRLPPRSGKSLIALGVASALDTRSVLLVDKQGLLKQHYRVFADECGADVGIFGAGKRDLDHNIVISTFQSIAANVNDDEVCEWMDSVGLMQVDECHHLGSAATYQRVVTLFRNAVYRIGYSATPFRFVPSPDKLEGWNFFDFALVGMTGDLLYQRTSSELRDIGTLQKARVTMIPVYGTIPFSTWPVMYARAIVHNWKRNHIIGNCCRRLAAGGHQTLVIVKEIRHGKNILRELAKHDEVKPLMVLGGNRIARLDNPAKKNKEELVTEYMEMGDVQRAVAEGEINTLVATSVADEGIDFPTISAVVMAAGGKSTIKTIQRSFRAMTAVEGKKEAVVIDFDDNGNKIFKKQSAERQLAYESEGLEVLKLANLELLTELGAMR